MKKNMKAVTLALVCAMMASMSAGCGANPSTSDPSSEASGAVSSSAVSSEPEVKKDPVTLEWLAYNCYGQPQADAQVVQEMEERFNVKFDFWFIDDQKWEEMLGARLASGEMPDVMRIKNSSNIPSYVKQGVLAPIDENIQSKIPETMKVINELDPDGTGFTDSYYNGQLYLLKTPTVYGDCATILMWRKDWLTKLGMEIPTTIDELENVLVAVRDNDPDGDGAKDTYGLSNTSLNAVFGAYGDIPMKEFRGTGSQKLYYTMRDGKVVFACVQPEMKEALTKLQQWYKDGLIDPEFVTGENTGGYWAISQAFNNDKIAVTGMVTPYHWLTPESDEIAGGPCWTEFVALHPDTELGTTVDFGTPFVGPEGKSGTQCTGFWSNSGFGITTQCAEDEDKLNALTAIMEGLVTDNDLYQTCRLGIEGVDWKYDAEGIPQNLNERTTAESDERGIAVFTQVGLNYEMMKNVYRPYVQKYFEDHKVSGYTGVLVPSTEAETTYLTDLKTFALDAYIKFITGEESMDKWEDFVNQFNSLGGQQIVDEINAALGK